MARRQNFGSTWWAQRFLAALESQGWEERLKRGRTYARNGSVLDLKVTAGQVAARVQGSRAKPYRVTVRFELPSSSAWRQITAALASRADCVKDLLSGQMPAEVEAIFSEFGAPLFPNPSDGLAGSCTCPDWAIPCKHVAAVIYRLSQELDANPWLLLELRGRTRDSLVKELQAQTAGAGLTAQPLLRPGQPSADRFAFWTGSLGLPPARAGSPAPTAVLDRLGEIPHLNNKARVHAHLQAYYRLVAERAQELLDLGARSSEETKIDSPRTLH